MSNPETILVIAPHPDDESIGCGGSIAMHRARGDRVVVLFLTSGEMSMKDLPDEQVRAIREAEALQALAFLDAESVGFLRLPDGHLADDLERSAAAVANAIRDLIPDRIYLPHEREDHADHAAALPMLARAYAMLNRGEPWLLGYEVWTPMERYDHVEDVSAVHEKKLSAVRCHQSQLKQFAYDRGVAGLNAYRGAMAAHCGFAEVFVSMGFS
jgi:LmbE family N-acetylglucosaminyl deacetylase